MLNIYHPGLQHKSDSELIEAWGRDYGLTLLEVMNFSADERREALDALNSLVGFWTPPFIREPDDNPFWMQDEGYTDAERDTKTLAIIARQVFDRRPQ